MLLGIADQLTLNMESVINMPTIRDPEKMFLFIGIFFGKKSQIPSGWKWSGSVLQEEFGRRWMRKIIGRIDWDHDVCVFGHLTLVTSVLNHSFAYVEAWEDNESWYYGLLNKTT